MPGTSPVKTDGLTFFPSKLQRQFEIQNKNFVEEAAPDPPITLLAGIMTEIQPIY